MKGIKITITCLLLIVFSALLCCTILSWDYLTTEEKKEFTKAEMLANYELGRNDEKANTENTISNLITSHNEELIKLENEKNILKQEINKLNSKTLKLQEEKESLSLSNNSNIHMIENLNQQIAQLNTEKEILNTQLAELEPTITQLQNEITDLNMQINELEKENQEMQSYTIKIYAPDGDLYSTKSVMMNTTGYLPNYLEKIYPNGIIGGNVEKWIIEYTDTEILTGEKTQICQVLNAGELITINADMTFKAVSNGCKVLDVSIVDTGGIGSKFTKVCENTLLSNIFSCSLCQNSNFQIQEEINGEWSEPITLNYSDINSYTITNNIKITHYHQYITITNPSEPHNLW